MAAKTNRKPTARKPAKPRRAPNGRFKGQPRTISETVMPDEYAPGAEVPRGALNILQPPSFSYRRRRSRMVCSCL